MKLNCKPGDLAIVVSGRLSAGRVVRCVRMMNLGESVVSKCGVILTLGDLKPTWELEGYVFITAGNGEIYEAPMGNDSSLRPIRDSGVDMQDETLLWAGLPVKEHA